jgi:hypothetical protein
MLNGTWKDGGPLIGVSGALLLTLASLSGRPFVPASEPDWPGIVAQALEVAVVRREIPDFRLMADPSEIVLADDGIDPAWVPEFPGIRFRVLDADQIREKADREGDYLHLAFRALALEEDGSVTVTLENRWAVPTGSDVRHVSGGGFRMTFRKAGGTWTGTITSRWMS